MSHDGSISPRWDYDTALVPAPQSWLANLALWLACTGPACLSVYAWVYSVARSHGPVSSAWSVPAVGMAVLSPVAAALGLLLLRTLPPYLSGRKRAQTAVLLGVVGSLWAAMLYPIFAHARSHSGPSCTSNLKRVELACQMYAQDYDNRLPLATNWSDSVAEYDKNDRILDAHPNGTRPSRHTRSTCGWRGPTPRASPIRRVRSCSSTLFQARTDPALQSFCPIRRVTAEDIVLRSPTAT